MKDDLLTLIQPYDVPGTVLISSVMVMTIQRGKERLRTKEEKDAPVSQTQPLVWE